VEAHGRAMLSADMNVKLAIILLTPVATLCVLRTTAPAFAQTRSVVDGVYTEAQADRGKGLYASKCGSCHGSALTGGEFAPALVGSGFTSNWTGLTLGDLFERTRMTMPQDAPGTLSAQHNADILAFMLSANTFPPGTTELPKDAAPLKAIKFEAK
jgi:quinoprotein glucose dehydrogenase